MDLHHQPEIDVAFWHEVHPHLQPLASQCSVADSKLRCTPVLARYRVCGLSQDHLERTSRTSGLQVRRQRRSIRLDFFVRKRHDPSSQVRNVPLEALLYIYIYKQYVHISIYISIKWTTFLYIHIQTHIRIWAASVTPGLYLCIYIYIYTYTYIYI